MPDDGHQRTNFGIGDRLDVHRDAHACREARSWRLEDEISQPEVPNIEKIVPPMHLTSHFVRK